MFVCFTGMCNCVFGKGLTSETLHVSLISNQLYKCIFPHEHIFRYSTCVKKIPRWNCYFLIQVLIHTLILWTNFIFISLSVVKHLENKADNHCGPLSTTVY